MINKKNPEWKVLVTEHGFVRNSLPFSQPVNAIVNELQQSSEIPPFSRNDGLSDGGKGRELGEVFEIKNGYTPSKANPEFWTDDTIPWFRMEDIRQNGRIFSDSIQHITSDAAKGSGIFPANSIIVATTATIGEHTSFCK